MAHFDLLRNVVCLRIVYDGVAGAGKTTNIAMLAELFAPQRVEAFYSPLAVDGRTVYFDWMQIQGGSLGGLPLLCQVISVPGHVVLAERRRHLLSTADAIVYVCESTAEGIAEGLAGLGVLAAMPVGSSPALLVVQANKQDSVTAVAGPALLEGLGITDSPCVEAIARDGIGVVDTFMTALRAVTRRLHDQLEAGTLRLPVDDAATAASLLEQLQSLEIDGDWAAEMLLEEAARAYRDLEIAARPAPSLPPARVHYAPVPRADVANGCIWPAHGSREGLQAFAGNTTAAVDAAGLALLRAGGYRLETSSTACFADAEAGRQALVRGARERTRLGSLLPTGTSLVLQSTHDGESWVWTLVPDLVPVQDWLQDATEEVDRTARQLTVAHAVDAALQYASAYEIPLGAAATDFGVEQGTVRYLGALGAGASYDAAEWTQQVLAALVPVDQRDAVAGQLRVAAADRAREA